MSIDIEAFNSLVASLKLVPEENLRVARASEGTMVIKASPRVQLPGSMFADIEVEKIPQIFAAICTYKVPSLNLKVSCVETVLSPRFQELHKYISSLGGNEVEVDTTDILNYDMSPAYWDSDWKGMPQNWGTHGRIYSSRIYPTFLRTILDYLHPTQDGKDIQIVDLFGGDGEFLDLLSSGMDKSLSNSCTFHLIDASAVSLAKAKKLFRSDEKKAVIHEPRYLEPDKPVFDGLCKPPRYVTAVGGICAGVISRKEALGIAGRVYDEMEQGGIFFVTGMSACLLNAHDFSSIGFKVRQMTKPENVVYLANPYQLYVLQK